MVENCCEVNVNLIEAFHKAQDKKVHLLRLVLTVMGGLFLVRLLMGLLSNHVPTTFGMITMAVNVCVVYFLCFSTPMAIKKQIGYFREFTGSQSAELTYRFGDTIQVICDDKTMELTYKQITMVEVFADHVVLGIQKNMMLFVAIDGFTKGTFTEFKQFLREKRPDLKIPE